MSEQVFYTTNVINKKLIANDIIELTVGRPSGFDFVAGQFVRIKIPQESGELLRSYSLSSIPSDKDLQFCIKVIEGGKGSVFLGSLDKGAALEISAPRGRFVCSVLSENNYFVATGAGIAPLISMIEDSVSKHSDKKFELLFGVRDEKDVFWEKRLERLSKEYLNFSYRITLTQPGALWKGLAGRVSEHLILDPKGEYYLCGNAEMVKDIHTLLQKNNVNTKNVHFEIF
jgi:ferredoxin-NADP reductase